MTGLGIIEVAIGLIFVYSLLSIIATTLNTIIGYLFKTRARHLKRGLETLLTDPDVRSAFMRHPLINLMRDQPMQRSRWEEAFRFVTNLVRFRQPQTAMMSAQMVAQETATLTRVDWIDPEMFARVITDILAEKAALTLYAPLSDAVQVTLTGAERDRMTHLVELLQAGAYTLEEFQREIFKLGDPSHRAELQAAFEQVDIRRRALNLTPNEGSRVIPILEGLRQVHDESFRKAIRVLVSSARSLEEAQAQLETWFDQRMDQLSEMYKRRITMFSLLIGIFLSIILNADTLQIARALFDDPALRAALVAAANQAVENNELQNMLPTPTPAPTSTPEPTPTADPALELLPTAEASAGLSDDITAQAAPLSEPTPEDNPIGDMTDAIVRVEQLVVRLLQFNLPIAWEYTPLEINCFDAANTTSLQCGNTRNFWLYLPGNSPDGFWLWVRKLIGLALTTLAIAQGAPFWFDLLNRLVRGRS